MTSVKPRVLIIDDEPQVGKMLSRLLRRDYEVVAVTSATEALPLALDEDWDAILCDVMMPVVSGSAFLAQLETERPEIVDRVGFMTGGALDPEVRRFLDSLGEDGWLAKPFGRDAVLAFVERLRTPD